MSQMSTKSSSVAKNAQVSSQYDPKLTESLYQNMIESMAKIHQELEIFSTNYAEILKRGPELNKALSQLVKGVQQIGDGKSVETPSTSQL